MNSPQNHSQGKRFLLLALPIMTFSLSPALARMPDPVKNNPRDTFTATCGKLQDVYDAMTKAGDVSRASEAESAWDEVGCDDRWGSINERRVSPRPTVRQDLQNKSLQIEPSSTPVTPQRPTPLASPAKAQ